MSNSIIRLIQSALIGTVLGSVGYSFKTIQFWIVMVIMALQWVKENI